MKFLIGDDEFELLRRILEQEAGLVHDESRRDSLAFSVAGRVEATGASSIAAYLQTLAGPGGAAERQRLLDVVTIQETHFFRNPPQIRALRQYVLPELIRTAVTEGRPLRIWSAGCSTGEEPYTVAMLVRELLPMATREHVHILGTDISTSALSVAESARYGPRAVQMAEPTDLARWFVPQGDAHVVRDDVRELVELRRHNLITQTPPFEPGEVDLVLCRNVTIYFNRATTKALMARFHQVLGDGGYLFLGHAETLWQMSDAFTLVPLGDAFVYRRDSRVHTAERRATLPERRTEAGDPPIMVAERRVRADRRRRQGETTSSGGAALTLPAAPALPPSLPAVAPAWQPSTLPPTLPAGDQFASGGRPSSRRPASDKPGSFIGAQRKNADAATGDVAHVDHLTSARLALAAGRYADAVVAAARASRADPMLVDPHLISGEALVNLGRDADAVKELRQAVYLQGACAPAHLLLAGALDRLGEHAAAGRAYRAAAATVSDLPPEAVGQIFGGRSGAELVDLCLRLAMQAERAARNAHGDHRDNRDSPGNRENRRDGGREGSGGEAQ